MKTINEKIKAATWRCAVAGIAVFASASAAGACPDPGSQSLITVTGCAGGRVESVSFDSIERVIDLFNVDDDGGFPWADWPEVQHLAQYNLKTPADYGLSEETSAAEVRVNFRGLHLIASVPENSSAMTLSIPSLGINETFDGGNRDASAELAGDYLENNGERLYQELLRVSPVDPLAGNPSSLQSDMVAASFEAGMDLVGSSFDAGIDPVYDNVEKGGSFGIGTQFGRFSYGDYDQDVYKLPISYAYTFSNYDKIIISAPLTLTETEGARAYRANLNVGYRKNLSARWSLTPSIGYGITGSDELGSLGHLVSVALTSDLTIYRGPKYQVSLGNMVGYYHSMPVRYADIDIDYDLNNTIIRNGLLVSVPLQKRFWGRDFSLDFYVTDTRFFGDEVYSDNFQEIGFSFGPRHSANKLKPNTSSQPIGIGIKYLRGDGDIEGLQLSFGYRF
jgi:hypothetical protein